MLRQPLLLLPCALIAGSSLGRAKRRVVVKNSVMILLGLSIVIGAWSVRNYRVFGKPVITSTMGGPSLYRSFHPQAGRYYTNVGWDRLVTESDGDEIRLNELAWHYGLRFIIEDPTRAAVRVLRNWHRLLESDHEIAVLRRPMIPTTQAADRPCFSPSWPLAPPSPFTECSSLSRAIS